MTIPEEIEQLKMKLAETAAENEQADVLMEILKKYVSINSFDSQPYIDRLLELSEKLNEPLYKARAFQSLAALRFLKEEYNVAINLIRQSLALYIRLDEKNGIATCYNALGNVCFRQGNCPKALKNYFDALKIWEELSNKSATGAIYSNIGLVYYVMEDYTEALKNYFNGLKIGEEIGNKKSIANCYGNMGSVYERLGNYPEALKNHFGSLKLMKELGDKVGEAGSYINVANIYKNQGNYTEAVKNMFAALEIHKAAGHKIGIAHCNLILGNIYYEQGNYAAAVVEQLEALTIAEEILAKELLKNCSISLATSYKANMDFEKALKYYEKYHEVEKQMLGEESTRQLNNLNFMHNMEQKEKDLEIEHLRNVELKKERDRSENLLLNILPGEVAEELKEKGTAEAKMFDDVTVLFTDFKSFTTVSERLTPQQLVDELHACFSAFDGIMDKYNIEKIKTVGDAYLAVSGLPKPNSNHAEDMVKAAIEIRNFMLNRKHQTSNIKLETFEVRIGVHSGSVVAGIVGIKKFAYDIWGDTVNTAARMEQNGEAGKINISQTTYQLVKNKFACDYRGEIEAKNKGKLKMYFVE